MEETRSRAASGGLRAWFLALRLLIALAAACDCSPDSGSGIFVLRGCVHGVRLDVSRFSLPCSNPSSCPLVVPYCNYSFVQVRVLNCGALTYLSSLGVLARATHKAHTKTPMSTPMKKHAACVKKLNIK
ncbi:hypothetical protein [Burkholderia sp. S171]|uniref:hypothetical protein n=1 Tax=Burkholderia sp. S171 TaxID=1641860 RepID=UPI00131BD56B|nr:hypothetical protein [Burkholderia sp. S171]